MTPLARRTAALAAGALALAGAGGCAKTVSTSSFAGEQRDVAKAISDLQSDVTASDEHKVCANDLAHSLVTRLGPLPGGCLRTVKDQLDEVDNFDLTVESVQVHTGGTQPTASARVRSTRDGKTSFATLYLVKEGGRWKVSGSA